MSERIIKTGLGLHYKDMLDAVIGQGAYQHRRS